MPTATPTQNPPAVFSYPWTASDTFHGGGDACAGPKDEMIRIDVNDPDGVAGVQIYFQLQNKKTFEYFEWNNLPMTYETGRSLPHWIVDITGANILGNAVYGEEYWLQFYFVATDKTRAQTQSDLYQYLITYIVCPYIT